MRKLRILADLDNTTNKMWTETALELNKRYGDNWNPDDLESQTEWNFARVKEAYQIWGEPGFFRNVSVMEGALEVLPKLHAQGHEIFIVTASFSSVCDDKRNWIESHFPFLTWNKNVVVCSQKHIIEGDVLFDDNSDTNLANWKAAHPKGLAVACSAGYNRNWKGGPRAKNWYEFEKLVNAYIPTLEFYELASKPMKG